MKIYVEYFLTKINEKPNLIREQGRPLSKKAPYSLQVFSPKKRDHKAG